MNDYTWEQHVELEIRHAQGDPIRLMEILECLIQMERAALIPVDLSTRLIDQVQHFNHRP